MAVVSQVKKSTDLIRLWQNLNNTEEIDYTAIKKWADKTPPTLEEMCEADLRRAVKKATWINPRGEKVRIYGIPRIIFEDEVLTLAPVDMRYAKPEMAKNVQDANYKGIGNDVKRHSIETRSYNENNPYGTDLLPFYDYDFNPSAQEALTTGQYGVSTTELYDDSFDEDKFNEEQEGESEE
jgi:hypothetical protein